MCHDFVTNCSFHRLDDEDRLLPDYPCVIKVTKDVFGSLKGAGNDTMRRNDFGFTLWGPVVFYDYDQIQ